MKGIRKILAVTSLTAAFALAPILDANAALQSYLNLKGQKQGTLKSTVGKKSTKEPGIEVLAFSHEMKSSRDKASGQATGKRQHSAFHVTLELDTNIIAILIGLMQSGEQFDATITFATEKKKGKGVKQQEYLTYELENVMISSYQISSTTGGKDVVIVDLLPKSFEGKMADGSVFVSSTAAAAPPATVKSAN